MPYTPVELRHVHVGRGLLGYKRSGVDRVLDEVAESFETVWRDRADLAEKVERLEEQLTELKAREQLLIQTLASAEQVAGEVREQAKREAQVIIAEAHDQARAVWLSAQGERERLVAEARRVELYLRAALDSATEGAAERPGPAARGPLPFAQPQAAHEPAPAVHEDETPPAHLDEALLPEPEQPQGGLRRFLPKVVGGEPREFDWD